MHGSSPTRHPDLLVGIDGADDAGVYRIADDLALVQTVDFFTPIVDDARDWGRIAAANALSDVYAMGGTPLTALQIIGWPRDRLPLDLLGDVIDGALEILAEANCTVVGGHSIDDPEPKYGLAVTGLVRTDELMTNAAAHEGDRLVLTKPIGTGVISTAIKAGTCPTDVSSAAIASMVELNAAAALAAGQAGVRAATDVTGFGLLGHLAEMMRASGLSAELEADAVPLLPGAVTLAGAGSVPGGTHRNLRAATGFTDFGPLAPPMRTLLADAQTSGGLLLSVSETQLDRLIAGLTESGQHHAVIGTVREPVREGSALLTIR
jgi:selenide,water dikinase